MTFINKPIDDLLAMAKASYKLGDYSSALEYYEYFFDHGLSDTPSIYYGAHLSRCLKDWVNLGDQYPPALQRLEQKSYEIIATLEKNHSSRSFHEFMAICKYLKKPDEPIRCFLHYHESLPELAVKIVHYIWDELVQRKLWQVCATYIYNVEDKYNAALHKFTCVMEICGDEASFNNKETFEQVQSWYVRDVSNLLLVLMNTNKYDDVLLIKRQIVSDMNSKGYPHLVKRINERLALS